MNLTALTRVDIVMCKLFVMALDILLYGCKEHSTDYAADCHRKK